jgi:hypothetical protein
MRNLRQVFKNAIAYSGRHDAVEGEEERAWIDEVKQQVMPLLTKPCNFIMLTNNDGHRTYQVECTTCNEVLQHTAKLPQYCINDHLRKRYGIAKNAEEDTEPVLTEEDKEQALDDLLADHARKPEGE